MSTLSGKVAVVTGGATGIGMGIAREFTEEGASVWVVGNDESQLEGAWSALIDEGARGGTYQADVRSKDQVRAAMSACVEQLGSIDILVNNAGLFPNKPALDLSEDDWDEVVDTNLKGTFLCSQEAARYMVESGGGAMINISSTAARFARPGIAHYGASKAGIAHLTAILAVEWARSKIRVNCVAPGIIETEQVKKQAGEGAGRAEYESRRNRIPLGGFGAVEDVANAVAWLAGPKSKYCTGTVLTVDGGYALGVTSYE